MSMYSSNGSRAAEEKGKERRGEGTERNVKGTGKERQVKGEERGAEERRSKEKSMGRNLDP